MKEPIYWPNGELMRQVPEKRTWIPGKSPNNTNRNFLRKRKHKMKVPINHISYYHDKRIGDMSVMSFILFMRKILG